MYRPTFSHFKHAQSFVRSQVQRITQSPVVSNFCIYSLGAFVLRGTSVILAPITLHILSPHEYGIIALINSFASIATLVAGFGLRQVFSIEFYHHTSNSRRTLVNDIVIIYCVLATPLLALALVNCTTINHVLFLGSVPNTLIGITLVYCFLFFFVELFYQALRYQQKAFSLVLTQTGTAFGIIVLNVIFLWKLHWGVYSMIVSYLIGYTLVTLWGIRAYLRAGCAAHIDVRASLRKLTYYVRLGLPFIPSVLFSWILSSSDRWMLARMTSLHDVGLYALADAFGQLYQMLILYPLSSAYLPHLMQQFGRNKHNLFIVEQRNRTVTYWGMVIVACCITIGYFIGKPLVYWLLPAKYHAALHYVWFILMGYVFLTGTYCLSALIQFHKRTLFLAYALFIPALMNVVLNFLLIPRWHILGCVLATLIAQITYFCIVWWYSTRLITQLAAVCDKTAQDPVHTL